MALKNNESIKKKLRAKNSQIMKNNPKKAEKKKSTQALLKWMKKMIAMNAQNTKRDAKIQHFTKKLYSLNIYIYIQQNIDTQTLTTSKYKFS